MAKEFEVRKERLGIVKEEAEKEKEI